MPTEAAPSTTRERACKVSLKKLTEANGDYKKSDIAVPVKLSKEEKSLVLPKKKAGNKKKGNKQENKENENTPKKGGKKKKDDKFQMKISGFFSPNGSKSKAVEKDTEDEEESEEVDRERKESGDSRPDSGFASRSETPAVWSEDGSKSGSPLKEDLKEDVEAENKKFLDDLDKDSDKESEKADSEKEDEDSEKEESSSSDEDSEDDWNGDSDDGFKKAAKKPAPKKKAVKKKAAAASANALVIPGALRSEMSAYEKVRDDNIKERQAMLAALMADFSDFKAEAGLKNSKAPPKKKRRLDADGNFVTSIRPNEERRTSARLSQKPEDKEKLGSNKYTSDDFRDPEKRFRIAEECSDYDEDDYQVYEERTKKRSYPGRWAHDPNENVLMPEDITPTMLKKVCERFGAKVYNQTIGTSCHQCRQKTTDMKTICRSGECQGVRGQFCGRCLEIRYGEDAREALMDPNWSCPPCRGFCNCSICRNRNGKGATGILFQLAQSKGFDNAAAYLKSLQKKKGTDVIDKDD